MNNVPVALVVRQSFRYCVHIVLVALIATGLGCNSKEPKMGPSVYEATRIAIHAMEKDDVLTKEYRLTCRQVDNEWVFWFEFLPAKPDFGVTVIVSSDKSVRMGP